MYRVLIPLILVALAGCGTVREAAVGEPGAAFPHGQSYVLPSSHGLDAVADGASCESCHEVEATEDTAAPPVPACKDCHALYPHSEDYTDGTVHGDAWGSSCQSCHGELGDHVPAGQTDAVCTSCHDFPHGSGWLRADHHGVALMTAGAFDEAGDYQASCATCHDDTSSCTTCHPAYPHQSGWDHGQAYEDGVSCFGECHDGATELPGDITCDKCH